MDTRGYLQIGNKVVALRGLGGRLRVYRLSSGLTQAAMAQLLGVSHVSYHFWETGRYLPTGANRERVVRLLGGGVEVS